MNNNEVCSAINDVFSDTRSILEPSGALALAGLKKIISRDNIKDKKLVAIASGANVIFSQLRYISERSEMENTKEIKLSISLKEKHCSFLKLINSLGDNNITSVYYRYINNIQNEKIIIGLQVNLEYELENLLLNLEKIILIQ